MIEDEARVAFAAYTGLGRRIIDEMIAEIISLRASLAYCERLASQRAAIEAAKPKGTMP